MKFDETKYKQEYNKEHYKEFRAYLKLEEMQELESLLKKLNKTKAQFLRESIDKLKKSN